MICPTCGDANADTASRCAGCQQAFLRPCAICNRGLRVGDSSCQECGAAIDPPAEHAPGEAATTTDAAEAPIAAEAKSDDQPLEALAWVHPERTTLLLKVARAIGEETAQPVTTALAEPRGPAARASWRIVLEQARKSPDDLDAADLACVACAALIALGREANDQSPTDARALFDEGRALAAGAGSRNASLELAIEYGSALRHQSQTADALEVVRDAFRATDQSEEPRLLERIGLAYADALALCCRVGDLRRLTESTLSEASASDENWLAQMTFQRGWALILGGQLAEGEAHLERAAVALANLGQEVLASRALAARVMAAGLTGDEAIARAALQGAPEQGEGVLAARCEALLSAGQVDQALELARQGGNEDFRSWRGWHLAYEAEALLASERYDDAMRSAQKAVEFCRPRGIDFPRIRAHGVAARVLLRTQGRSAKSTVFDALADADALIERSGCTSLTPALEEWRAELVGTLGDTHAGDHRRREAARLYAAIGASGHARRLCPDEG